MSDLTVLYYSSCTEDERLEWHARNNVLRNKGNLPLVSVTQKPAKDFGENICVGEHFNCYGNEFRQIQIGLRAVKTKYVITAEADVLYPPEYFQFEPKNRNFYRYANVWLHFVRPGVTKPPVAFFKQYSDGAQIVKTKYWLMLLDKAMGKETEWYTKENAPRKLYKLETDPKNTWTSNIPVLSFKTLNNIGRYTTYSTKEVKPQTELPYWGNLGKLMKKVFRPLPVPVTPPARTETLSYVLQKYNIDLNQKSPFVLPVNRLVDLPELFKELNFKSGAEIGVLNGVFSEILCQTNPHAKIYSIDAWQFYPLAKNFRKPHHYPPIYESAKARLAPYKNNIIIRKWSMDALNDFADESLDFVFIDADHRFEAITNDIAQWSKKVRKGGIISGHDYHGRTEFVHVNDVVNAWTAAHYIHPWFVLRSPVSKHEDSWFWVKEK